jgi:hypothetical protein
MCSVTFRARSARDIVALAVSCGIHAIEWGADCHVPVGDLAAAAAVAQLCRNAGVLAASYGTYLRAGAGNTQAQLMSIAETAAVLGASNVRIWGGQRGVASAAASPELWSRAADELHRLAELAARRGTTLSLEFHADTLVDTGPSAVRLLEQVAHPALFTKWQPTPGITPAESIAQLTLLQPWLSHIDVFARDRERTRFSIETAAELWAAVFRHARPSAAWPTIPYALIEFVKDDAAQALRADAQFLEKLLGAA